MLISTVKRSTLKRLVGASALCAAVLSASVSYAQLSKPTALLKGEIRSEEDQSPVAGLQVAVIKGTDRVATARTNTDGKFTAIVQPGAQYRVSYSSNNYAYHEDTITVPTADKYQEVAVRSFVMPLRDNQDFTPKQAVFEHGSASISSPAEQRLEQLASIIRRNSKVRLDITVFPDQEIHSKKDAAQQKLLDARAAAVRAFFLGRNVPASNISVTAMPIATEGVTATAAPVKAAKGKKKKAAAPAGAMILPVVKITGHLSS